jgi:hypothetical protein
VLGKGTSQSSGCSVLTLNGIVFTSRSLSRYKISPKFCNMKFLNNFVNTEGNFVKRMKFHEVFHIHANCAGVQCEIPPKTPQNTLHDEMNSFKIKIEIFLSSKPPAG